MSRRRKHSRRGLAPYKPSAATRGTSSACSHELLLYPTAAAARAGAHAIRAGDAVRLPDPGAKLRPFQCGDVEGWHLGSLPAAVIAGRVDAATYFAGNAPADCYPPKERRYG